MASGSFLLGNGAAAVQLKTPAEVLELIGAAPAGQAASLQSVYYSGSKNNIAAGATTMIGYATLAAGTYLVFGGVTFAAGPSFVQCCLSETSASSLSPSWNGATKSMMMDSYAANTGKDASLALSCHCFGRFIFAETKRVHLMAYQSGATSVARNCTAFQLFAIKIA